MMDKANMGALDVLRAELHDARNGIAVLGIEMELGIYGCQPHEDDCLRRTDRDWWSRSGDVTERDGTLWCRINYTTSSDYVGGLVEASNRKALVELCEEYDEDEDFVELGDWYRERDGFPYASWLEIRCLPYLPEDVFGAIESLESYPLLDESLYSEMEQSLREEAWSDYGREDYRSDMVKAAATEAEKQTLESMSDDDIDSRFWAECDSIREYGYVEGLAYIFPDFGR